MQTKVLTVECPHCHETHEVGTIISPLVTICLCSGCHRCWEILNGKIDRLIRLKYIPLGEKISEDPETRDENLLCPICWRAMVEDFEKWVIRCPDPICGYEKRIPGLSKEQRLVKKGYLEVREELFSLASEAKQIPAELEVKYKNLQEQYNSIKKFDVDKV